MPGQGALDANTVSGALAAERRRLLRLRRVTVSAIDGARSAIDGARSAIDGRARSRAAGRTVARMNRHPSLAPLSRDHHHALVLARKARRFLSGGAEDAATFIAALRDHFDAELAPHFAIEERELVPRSVAHGEPLAALAARVVADHDALRAMVTSFAPASLPSRGEAFGALLEAHVRFEEREWFPALVEHLGSDALTRLAGALSLAPPAAAPSFDRMPRLPTDVAPYKTTPVFDAETVPAGLKRTHALKPDTWGEIIVERGRVLYVLEDEGDIGIMLSPGVVGVVAPERPHHVELEDDARFFVRFLKRGA